MTSIENPQTRGRRRNPPSQPIQVGAPRRHRRGRNWALTGMVVIAVAVVAYLVVTAILGLGSTSVPAYVTDDMTPLIDRSNELGDNLAKLVTRPEENLDTEVLRDQIDKWSSDATGLVVEAETLDPPGDLNVAHAQLVSVLALRAAAFEKYGRSIGEATGEIDDPTPLVQIFAEANRDFLAADRLYALFADDTAAILTDAGHAELALPESVYFPVPESGDEPATAAFARALFESDAVVGSHDMSLVSISLEPEPTAFDDDVQTIVGGGKDFEVSATIKNNGDRVENTVALKVTLRKSGAPDSEMQTATAEIDDLEPGASRTITVTDLDPEEGVNRLTVSVGPVANEIEDADNIETLVIDYAG